MTIMLFFIYILGQIRGEMTVYGWMGDGSDCMFALQVSFSSVVLCGLSHH